MYVIVIGGGNVGYGIATELQRLPDHEVTIVERDSDRASNLRAQLGEMVVFGDGSEVTVLESVGAHRADLLIAATADDNANLVTCQVAKHWFKIERTIARVNSPPNEELFRRLGVDSIVSAASAVMAQIEATLPERTLIPLLHLENSDLTVVDFHLQEDSPAVGKSLSDLSLPRQCLISLVVGADGPAIPDGNTVLHAGDEVIAVISEESEDEVRDLIVGHPAHGITHDPRPDVAANGS